LAPCLVFTTTDSKSSHARHLDKTYQAGPHTISIPRIRPADEAPDALAPPHPVNDDDFAKLVAVLRCAVPYTGTYWVCLGDTV
jgi:hypothetical protein